MHEVFPIGAVLRTGIISGFFLCLSLNGLAAQAVRPIDQAPLSPDSAALQWDQSGSGQQSWKVRLAGGLAAAAIGAGLGFFASQVVRGDWDEGGGRREIHRPVWAAAAGVGGFALGFSLPIWGRSLTQGASTRSLENRFMITAGEIRRASVSDALEAVRLFHPEWLVGRGQSAFSDPESDDIRVFLNDIPLGGVESLREVNGLLIESIRFFDAQRATARWGVGYSQGAIQVLTSHRESR